VFRYLTKSEEHALAAAADALDKVAADTARLDKAEWLQLHGDLVNICYGMSDAGTYPTLREALDHVIGEVTA
jgi:hypothetical protein